MLKVVHLTYDICIGGAEIDLINKSKILKKAGIEVVIIGLRRLGDLENEARFENIRLINLKAFCKYDIFAFFRLLKILKKEKPDILSGYLHKVGIITAIAGKLLRIKKIIVTHQTVSEYFSFPYKSLVRFFSKYVDEIIAASWAIKESLVKIGVKEDKIKVIYNLVDADRFLNIKQQKSNDFTLVTVARLVKVKGLVYIIEAARILKEEYKIRFRWFVVGDGALRKKLIKKARRNALDGYLIFCGKRKPDEFLRQADVFVLSSLIEGLSIAVMEAQASGLCVVASSVGGIKEIIEDNKSGFLVKKKSPRQIAERLFFLYKNREILQKMQKEARENFIKKFSPQNIIPKVLEVYCAA